MTMIRECVILIINFYASECVNIKVYKFTTSLNYLIRGKS